MGSNRGMRFGAAYRMHVLAMSKFDEGNCGSFFLCVLSFSVSFLASDRAANTKI